MRIVGGASFLAIYGSPSISATQPIGGGVGRNFGFGTNMLFQACTSCTTPVGTNLDITLEGKVLESKDAFIGGTLMSNTTGTGNPLSFEIQFADFQASTAAGVATPTYADTSDRPWIAEICGESAACKVDPRVAAKALQVEIQDVSLDIGPGIVVQGTVWGQWEGTKPPCIKLTLPPPAPLGVDTLVETQGPEPGKEITAVSGKACLISANNEYWRINSGELKEPEIKIEN
jgi:hypothetical protein